MLVYLTDEFAAKLDQYHIEDRFEILRARIEGMNGQIALKALFKPYPAQYYTRKEVSQNLDLRLIGRILRHNEHQVLCMLTILERKGREYHEFYQQDTEDYGEHHLMPKLSMEGLTSFLTSQLESPERQCVDLPALPESYRSWLDQSEWGKHLAGDDITIYESRSWVAAFRQKDVHKHWKSFYGIVLDATSNHSSGHSVDGWPGVLSVNVGTQSVLLFKDLHNAKTLFLIRPFTQKPQHEAIRSALEESFVVDCAKLLEEGMPVLEVLGPHARRAYPAFILADEDAWYEIEQEQAANLALSPEEKDVLTLAQLPLFINGRAGSGKSTMLLYRFAEYCHRALTHESHLPVIFLSFNPRLLDVAKEGVRAILDSHHRFIGSQNGSSLNNDEVFVPFKDFLISRLSFDSRHRFDPEKYVTFRMFLNLYRGEGPTALSLRLPSARKWSPELCWHVIRAFIKGYSLEEFMSPETYTSEVPRKERTVPEEAFRSIHETIWEQWYQGKVMEAGYWDDQDLIREVLIQSNYEPRYGAVFCDEAQDFTRLELRFIMQLSVFSKYDLGYLPVDSLPFAFAGDPFQTLNPTGFRWDAVQSVFYDEVIRALDPEGELGLQMNFTELRHNYRSSGPIVKAANLIQLARHVLFGSKDIKPQESWFKERMSLPGRYILGENISEEELRANLQDTIIIIPCEEGEESVSVQKDATLSHILGAMGREPRNVLSAVAAKGLEFRRVVLYKFGDACDENMWKVKAGDEVSRLKWEYFFNKLYVAASRAMEHLFVVDTSEGENRLWRHMDAFTALIEKSDTPDIWRDKVVNVPRGTGQMIAQMKEDDITSIAQEFEAKGRASGNPTFMRNASGYYMTLNKPEKSKECEAWALSFEGRHHEAGMGFREIGMQEQAARSFWEGRCWGELALLDGAVLASVLGTIQTEIVNFMNMPPKQHDALPRFSEFLNDKVNDIERTCRSQIREAASELESRLKSALSSTYSKKQWRQIGFSMKNLYERGLVDSPSLAGECFFEAGDYEISVKHFELARVTGTEKYFIAKAESVGYPKGFEYLANIRNGASNIVVKWEENTCPEEPSWVTHVAPALEKVGRGQDALRLYLVIQDTGRVLKLALKVLPPVAPRERRKYLDQITSLLIEKERYVDAVEFLDSTKLWHGVEPTSRAEQRYAVVKALARSRLPEGLAKGDDERLGAFINDRVVKDREWRNHVSPIEMEAALERCDRLVETVRFLEQYLESPDLRIREYSRRRWIVVNLKLVEYEVKQGIQTDRARRRPTEVNNRAHEWVMSQNIGDLGGRFPAASDIDDNKKQPVIAPGVPGGLDGLISKEDQKAREFQNFRILGVPPNAQVQETNRTLTVRTKELSVVLRPDKSTAEIAYADIDEPGTIRIDLKRGFAETRDLDMGIAKHGDSVELRVLRGDWRVRFEASDVGRFAEIMFASSDVPLRLEVKDVK